ncbi:fluoride efflux transporter FluC [Buchananella hordeovulneris]|uniref:fluoride efflux transporter FluC n=1 Tax=Buchananella hordeovulneris TaxID=52770 RepID=UPI000F5E385A|nr:CrcB family protein [Buchananella hordeovulneris]RRD43474.1 hypothetical protein EII13_07125 [Buchananella hordeovulneris]
MPDPSRGQLIAVIALGGAAGTAGRAWLAEAPAAPWLALSIVNLTGAVALGVVAGWPGLRPQWRAGLATGLCGAWTTYAGLALLAATGWQQLLAAAGQLVVGTGLAAAGLWVARRWGVRLQATRRTPVRPR